MKLLTITTPAGEVFGVPVDIIARNRAAYYAPLEFDGNLERSLKEDTGPLFDDDAYEIKDWAANNMNWSDVAAHAKKLSDAPPPNMQEAWMNGEKDVIDVPDEPPAEAPVDVQLVKEHPHDTQFLALALMVALERLGGSLVLTDADFEAAMQKGFITEPAPDGSVAITLGAREEVMAQFARITQEATDAAV